MGSFCIRRRALFILAAAVASPSWVTAEIVWDGTTNAYRTNHWGGSTPYVGAEMLISSGYATFDPSMTGQFLSLSNSSSDGQILDVDGTGTFSVSQQGPSGTGYGLLIDNVGQLDMFGTGRVIVAGPLSIGQDPSNSGSAYIDGGSVYVGYTLLGGSNIAAANGTDTTLYVGNGGLGQVTETSVDWPASVTAGFLNIGASSTAFGTYELQSGSLSVGTEYVGNAGSGWFAQSGGTNTVIGNLIIASAVGSMGNFTMAGGSTTVSGNVYVGGSSVGAGGTGTLNVSGGTLTVNSGSVTVLGSASLTVGGSLNISNGSFYDMGGSITGTVSLVGSSSSSTLYLGSSAVPGSFAFGGSNSNYVEDSGGSANISAGTIITVQSTSGASTLQVQPAANYGAITITSSNGSYGSIGFLNAFTNHGAITFAAVGMPSTAFSSPGFTNAVDGTVNINTSTTSTNATFVNYGTFNIASGQAFQCSTFNQTSGTLTVGGSLNISNGSFYDMGGSITGTVSLVGSSSSSTLYLGSSAVPGSFAFGGSNSNYVEDSGGSANISAGTIITVQSTSGASTLQVQPAANYGAITITSSNGSYGSIGFLNAFTNHGAITFAAVGMPSTAFSSPGFTNAVDGTVNINTSTTSTNATFVNYGTFNIASGQAFQCSTFNQTSGTLTVGGSLNISNGSFYDMGGSITGTVSLVGSSSSSTLYLGSSAVPGSFAFGGSNSNYVEDSGGSANISAGTIITVQSTSGASTLQVQPAANYGAITITSSNGSYGSIGFLNAFTNHGAITFAAVGMPSTAFSSPGFTNAVDGTVNINTSTTSTNATFVNYGTFNIASGQAFQCSTFNQTSGTLTVGGSLNISNGSFYDMGGSITGTVSLVGSSSSSTLYLGSSAVPGSFAFGGSNSNYVEDSGGSANISAGTIITVQSTSGASTLQVQPAANYGAITITSSNGSYGSIGFLNAFTNHGAITFAAVGMPSTAFSSPGFTNAVDGTVNINTSTTSTNATFVNYGTFNIASGQAFQCSTFNQTSGTLTVGGSLNISNGSFYDMGGSITGTVSLVGSSSSSTLYLGSSAVPGSFAFGGSNSNYVEDSGGSANISAGTIITVQSTSGASTLQVQPAANYGAITITSSNGSYGSIGFLNAFTNHGAITFAAVGMPSTAFSSPGFTNAVDGTVNINTSTTFSGSLINAGTVIVAAGTKLNMQSFALNISGGSIILNPSAVTPGSITVSSIYWPATAATQAAAITTTGATSATAGKILGASTSIDLEYAAGTLTVSADIAGSGIRKLGPGTLVLSGPNLFTGTATVNAGTLTLAQTGSLASTLVTVAAGATFNDMGSAPNAMVQSSGSGIVYFPSGSGTSPSEVQIKGLSIPSGQTDIVGFAASHAGRTLLATSTLTLAGGSGSWLSTLDLSDNDLDVLSTGFATIYDQVRQGYANDTWSGKGITSSAAANDTTHLTTLGVIQNNENGSALYGLNTKLFDGTSPGASDVLVKYTYYGDTDLSGVVDGSDYSRIDSAYVADSNPVTPQAYTGWFNGDFNYDGVINGSDYTLIDNAFNTQGAALTTEVATRTAEIAAASTTAVPEPGMLSLLAIGSLATHRRRRR